MRPSRDPKYGKTGCYTPVSLPVLLQESKNGDRHLAGCQLAVTKGLASEHPSGLPPTGCPEFEEGDNWSCRERTRQSTSTQPKADPGDLRRGKNVTLRRVALIPRQSCSLPHLLRQESPRWSLPGRRVISQLSCFFDIFVQLRSSVAGCLLMMPLSIRGVMDLQWLRSILVHSLLSQHLEEGGQTHLGEKYKA